MNQGQDNPLPPSEILLGDEGNSIIDTEGMECIIVALDMKHILCQVNRITVDQVKELNTIF